MDEFPRENRILSFSFRLILSTGLLVLLSACNPNPHQNPDEISPTQSPPSQFAKPEESHSNPKNPQADKIESVPINEATADLKPSSQDPNLTTKSDALNQAKQAPVKSHPGYDVSLHKPPRANSKASLTQTDFVIRGQTTRSGGAPAARPNKAKVHPEAKEKLEAQKRQLEALKRAMKKQKKNESKP